jgi:hypothetical protein
VAGDIGRAAESGHYWGAVVGLESITTEARALRQCLEDATVAVNIFAVFAVVEITPHSKAAPALGLKRPCSESALVAGCRPVVQLRHSEVEEAARTSVRAEIQHVN